MDIKFQKKKKVFRKPGSQIRPDLYWGFILLIAFGIFVFSIIFGFILFLRVNKEGASVMSGEMKQEYFRKERLSETLDYLKKREEKSREILNSPSPIIDPSL